jgi:hypothetical protein
LDDLPRFVVVQGSQLLECDERRCIRIPSLAPPDAKTVVYVGEAEIQVHVWNPLIQYLA